MGLNPYLEIFDKRTDTNTKVRHWHVAYTAPRAEKRISEQLDRAGIEYYLALRTEIRQWSDRLKKVSVPVFPSYIFLHVDRSEYYVALNLPGMVRYVSFGGSTVIISDKNMMDIKKIVDNSACFELCNTLPAPGDPYTIPFGMFKGIEGTIVRLKGKTQFILEIQEWGKYLVLPFNDLKN